VLIISGVIVVMLLEAGGAAEGGIVFLGGMAGAHGMNLVCGVRIEGSLLLAWS
jgi:hypothetical protein